MAYTMLDTYLSPNTRVQVRIGRFAANDVPAPDTTPYVSIGHPASGRERAGGMLSANAGEWRWIHLSRAVWRGSLAFPANIFDVHFGGADAGAEGNREVILDIEGAQNRHLVLSTTNDGRRFVGFHQLNDVSRTIIPFKGMNLTENEWKELVKHRPSITTMLDNLYDCSVHYTGYEVRDVRDPTLLYVYRVDVESGPAEYFVSAFRDPLKARDEHQRLRSGRAFPLYMWMRLGADRKPKYSQKWYLDEDVCNSAQLSQLSVNTQLHTLVYAGPQLTTGRLLAHVHRYLISRMMKRIKAEGCDACKVDAPSTGDHCMIGGCLEEEDWYEVRTRYPEAKRRLDLSMVAALFQKVAERLGLPVSAPKILKPLADDDIKAEIRAEKTSSIIYAFDEFIEKLYDDMTAAETEDELSDDDDDVLVVDDAPPAKVRKTGGNA